MAHQLIELVFKFLCELDFYPFIYWFSSSVPWFELTILVRGILLLFGFVVELFFIGRPRNCIWNTVSTIDHCRNNFIWSNATIIREKRFRFFSIWSMISIFYNITNAFPRHGYRSKQLISDDLLPELYVVPQFVLIGSRIQKIWSYSILIWVKYWQHNC